MSEGAVFDHVVIGAGSAGCVIAARLSEDPATRVLLLEAGSPRKGLAKSEITIPAAFGKLFRSGVDWDYATTPQEGLAGREIYWPRGKTLGGSSAINAMMYIRGQRADYDGWGISGWGYDELLPYFRRSEDNERGASPLHGAGGPQPVSDQRDPNRLTRALVEGAVEAGVGRLDDHNVEAPEGVAYTQVLQRRGKRVSAAAAYLDPARSRSNLTVVAGAHATRVLVEGTRAVGVEYRAGGSTRQVRCAREIVLSAGAVNSPQLLMLSGIGPRAALAQHGITLVHELAGVGQNLQDHLVGLVHVTSPTKHSLYGARAPWQLLRYVLARKGMLTSNVGEAAAFVRTRPELHAPDLELLLAPVLYWREGLVDPPEHGFTIGLVVLAPCSSGFVALRSDDPFAKPLIGPRYLSDPDGEDMRVLVEGVKLARRIVAARALGPFVGRERTPGPEARTDEQIAASQRAVAHTLYHPVGTCRMGADQASVVDPELRVRGIDGLRVADCSVIPVITRGHTHAPAAMIGEKAAEMIRGATRA